ncbi:MAG: PQQ-dependent sugar dehydrogenase [Planctomycetota bacterium]
MSDRSSVALIALLWAGACSNGDRVAVGLAERVQVRGLTFPDGLPSPTPLTAVPAFPGLLFDRPLFLTAPPDGTDRIAVVEQDGLVRIFANDAATSTTATFMDLRALVSRASNEEGLLGFAFHPDYATTGEVFVYYSAASPRRSVLSRWRVSGGDPNAVDPASEQILLEFAQPYGNHNGGCLAFGPDGMLYITSGDGGSGSDPHDNGQSLTTLLGKVLRLAPDGSIPADNPFVGGSAGERGEIWAYGLRHPWRMSFDRATGDLWLGDVGQNAIEEIDRIERGGNYGWRLFEGTLPHINPGGFSASSVVAPVYEYDHAVGASVTGGYVYRGSALPTLTGSYVYADFGSSRVWALVHDGTRVISNTEIARVANPASFGEDAAGELYVCSFDGLIYRFEDPAPPATTPAFPATLAATGLFADVERLEVAPGVIEYGVQAPLWSDGASKRRWIALPGTARIGFDPTDAWAFPVGTVLVKHFEIEVRPGQVQRLETRVLLNHSTGWQGYTYRWNAAQTGADLLAGAASEVLTVIEASGVQRQQTWEYPSRTDCMSCHTAAAGRVLGVTTGQLNGDFAYGAGITANQLRTWNHIELFDTDIGSPAGYAAFVEPGDATQTDAARARAYLAANCSMCHRPGGPTPVDLDLRHEVANQEMQVLGIPAVAPISGSPGPLRIAVGSAAQSELWLRLQRRDAFGMPPLGSSVIDDAAVGVVGRWIDGLPPAQ